MDVMEADEFLKSAVNGAHNLQVLVLEGELECSEKIFLDEFCSILSSHPTLLSTLRLLQVNNIRQGYIMSRGIFDHLVKAYFLAPTDHPQKLHFENTKIKALNVIHYHLKLERQYRHFKSIALQDCKFVSSCKVNPGVISNWLNEEVSVRDSNQLGLWQFQVKDSST